MSYTLRINKPLKDSQIDFELNSSDLIKKIDEKTYSSVVVNEGSVVTYIVTNEGYKEIRNTLSVDRNITLNPELQKYVKIKIDADPNAKVVFEVDGKQYEEREITVLSNSIVKYTLTQRNKEPISDTIIASSDLTIEAEMIYKITTDEDVARYEKDKIDAYANMKIINKKQYKKLPPEEKVHYVLYDERLSNRFNLDYLTRLCDAVSELYWMIPYAQMISPYTNGSISTFQNNFLLFLEQLRGVASAATTLNGKLNGIRRPLNKVGLGSIIEIFTITFSTIGSLAGIIYAILNNPQILIKPYAEAIKDVNLDEIRNNMVNNVFPGIDYARGRIERTYIADPEVKASLLQNVNEIYGAANLSMGGLSQLYNIKNMALTSERIEDELQNILELISSMGYGWAMGSLPSLIHRLRKDHSMIKRNMSGTLLSHAQELLRIFLNKILYKTKKYYIRIGDLKRHYNVNVGKDTRIKYKYENGSDSEGYNLDEIEYTNGFNEGLENGQNGGSEQQKNDYIEKYTSNKLELGEDPSAYIDGYNQGWQSGNNSYNNEINYIYTDIELETHNNGYNNGYEYGNNLPEYAQSSLKNGQLIAFIDIDNHIHLMPMDYLEKRFRFHSPRVLLGSFSIISPDDVDDDNDDNENTEELTHFNENVPVSIYTPIGRIDNENILWLLDEQMNEYQYGKYDPNTSTLIDNDGNTISYVYNKLIYITDIIPDVTDENIEDEKKMLYDITVMELERQAPYGNTNPYYINGWKKGFEDRKEYNNKIETYVSKDSEGNETGYEWFKEGKTTEDIMHELNQNKINTNNQVFYNDAIMNPLNRFNSNNTGILSSLNSDVTPENASKYFSQGKSLDEILYEYDQNNKMNEITYYNQGIIRGYNRAISDYNSGYSLGWYGCLRTNEIYYKILHKYGTYKISDKPVNGIINNKVYPMDKKAFVVKAKRYNSSSYIMGYIESENLASHTFVYDFNQQIIGKLLIKNDGNTTKYYIYDHTKEINGRKWKLFSSMDREAFHINENDLNYPVIYEIEEGMDNENNYLLFNGNNIIGYGTQITDKVVGNIYNTSINKNIIGVCYFAKTVSDLENNFLNLYCYDNIKYEYKYNDEYLNKLIVPESYYTGNVFYRYINNKEIALAKFNNRENIVDIDAYDDIDPDLEEFLKYICETYGLNYNEEISKPVNEQSPIFRGAYEGYDDRYNNASEQRYKEYYLDY